MQDSYDPISSTAGSNSTSIDNINTRFEEPSTSQEDCNNGSCTSVRNITSFNIPTNSSISDHREHIPNRQTTESTEVDLGELMIVPDGNGTRITNFSSLLSEIFEKSNFSNVKQATTVPPTTVGVSQTNTSSNCTKNQSHNIACGAPVREVKFQTANSDKVFHGRVQVSGINSGSVSTLLSIIYIL